MTATTVTTATTATTVTREVTVKFRKLDSKEAAQVFFSTKLDPLLVDRYNDPAALKTEETEEIKDLAKRLDQARCAAFAEQHSDIVRMLISKVCVILNVDMDFLLKEKFIDTEGRPCDGKGNLQSVSTFDRAAAWVRLVNNFVCNLKNQVANAAKEKRTARDASVIRLFSLLKNNPDRHNIILDTFPGSESLLEALEHPAAAE